MSVDSDKKIFFEITGHNLSLAEQELYRKAIKNYYREEFLDVQDDMKLNRRNTILMLVSGAFFILLRLLLPLTIGWRLDFLEPINIVAWVFLWEAVELQIFKRPKLKEIQIRNLKILEAEIEFKEKVRPEDII